MVSTTAGELKFLKIRNYILVLLLWCTYRNGNEENHLVGWPPVKSWRRKELHQHHPGRGEIRNVGIQNQSRGPNSLYVKVNMEGVTIGRKINLRLFNSYKTLTNALINMFAKCKWIVLHFFSCCFEVYMVDSVFDFVYTLCRPKIGGSWRKLHTHLSKRARGLAASRTCSMAVSAYFIHRLILFG